MVAVADDRGKPLRYSSLQQRIANRHPESYSSWAVHDFPGLFASELLLPRPTGGARVSDSDAYRLVFSEADFLPGLIVDRYHDLLSLQILTQAMDNETARAAILSGLEELKPAGRFHHLSGWMHAFVSSNNYREGSRRCSR